jgi:magnesium transporter
MNVVIKFLTAVTIVLTLPTVITSFYGMNVRLPLQDWPFASWLILGASLIIAVFVVFTLLKRDWM